MNKKYYNLNEDRWELPDFDEWKGRKLIDAFHFDPNLSDLEWEDFDNSEINWSGMNYRTKKERERDNNIISELKQFFEDTKSNRVTEEDKLEEGKWYSRISFPRWSTKTKKYYKKTLEKHYLLDKTYEIDLNKDNTDEIRRLIKYYPEYDLSKYLFINDIKYFFLGKLRRLTGSLLCIVEILTMKYIGEKLIPYTKSIFWNNKYLEIFEVYK